MRWATHLSVEGSIESPQRFQIKRRASAELSFFIFAFAVHVGRLSLRAI